jgi:hypothetical protein
MLFYNKLFFSTKKINGRKIAVNAYFNFLSNEWTARTAFKGR